MISIQAPNQKNIKILIFLFTPPPPHFLKSRFLTLNILKVSLKKDAKIHVVQIGKDNYDIDLDITRAMVLCF